MCLGMIDAGRHGHGHVSGQGVGCSSNSGAYTGVTCGLVHTDMLGSGWVLFRVPPLKDCHNLLGSTESPECFAEIP